MEITKNNSKEMKTEVETFVIEETAELIYDNEKLEQWNSMVEELGLMGQTKIVKKDKSPIPFLRMNSSMVAIFETLCPSKTAVETYSLTPIPVEILSLVKLSKSEEYFHKIQIWYDDKSPDPCCVGLRWPADKPNETWEGYAEKYLLGKWSDVKQSFSELRERAKQRWRLEQSEQLKLSIKRYQRDLEDIDSQAEIRFGVKSSGVSNDLPF